MSPRYKRSSVLSFRPNGTEQTNDPSLRQSPTLSCHLSEIGSDNSFDGYRSSAIKNYEARIGILPASSQHQLWALHNRNLNIKSVNHGKIIPPCQYVAQMSESAFSRDGHQKHSRHTVCKRTIGSSKCIFDAEGTGDACFGM
jgi:hypothetical protein